MTETKQKPITTLFDEWLAAKTANADAYAYLIATEQSVIAHFGDTIETAVGKSEGSKTLTEAGIKVTLTAVINRKFNKEVDLMTAMADIPPELQPVKFEPSLDVTGVKWLQANRPELYSKFAKAIIVTPGKPSVKMEKVKG